MRWIHSLLLASAFGLAADGLAQPVAQPDLATAIEALVTSANLPGATLGIVVVEAASGRVIYQHAPDVPLNPASNAKVLTAAAALSILGPDHRFSTGLYGERRANAVVGPLVLRSEGDPSLRTEDLWTMGRELFAQGVRRVEGDLVVDDGNFGTQHLPPAFEQQPQESSAFRASVGAVSVDENTLRLRVAPGATVGAPAVVSTEPSGYLQCVSTLTTAAAGTNNVNFVVTVGPDGREHGRVSGAIPLGTPSAVYARRLESPGLAAGYALRNALESAGIRVRGRVRVGASSAPTSAMLTTHRSAPLSALLYEVGKDSNNFYAEMTLLAIAAAPMAGATGAASFERGAQRVEQWARQAGVSTVGMTLRNGSGLYDANRVSANQLAGALRATWRDPAIRDEFIAQLAVGGDDGTLHNRLRLPGAERWVRAKTGTLNDAIALSGYVLTPEVSRTWVFSFLSNGVQGHAPQARQLADGIVALLVHNALRTP